MDFSKNLVLAISDAMLPPEVKDTLTYNCNIMHQNTNGVDFYTFSQRCIEENVLFCWGFYIGVDSCTAYFEDTKGMVATPFFDFKELIEETGMNPYFSSKVLISLIQKYKLNGTNFKSFYQDLIDQSRMTQDVGSTIKKIIKGVSFDFPTYEDFERVFKEQIQKYLTARSSLSTIATGYDEFKNQIDYLALTPDKTKVLSFLKGLINVPVKMERNSLASIASSQYSTLVAQNKAFNFMDVLESMGDPADLVYSSDISKTMKQYGFDKLMSTKGINAMSRDVMSSLEGKSLPDYYYGETVLLPNMETALFNIEMIGNASRQSSPKAQTQAGMYQVMALEEVKSRLGLDLKLYAQTVKHLTI